MNWLQGLREVFTDTESPKQRQFIEDYQWSSGVRERFARQHPQLTSTQQEQVWEALRDYFAICHGARGKMVAMPSRVVDDAWHTFLLFTHEYSDFCHRAYGRYLHHTPHEESHAPGPFTATTASAKPQTKTIQKQMALTWRLACKREGLDPASAERLPRIFAIDAELGIKDGFLHDLRALRRHNSDGGSGCSSGGCSGSSGGGSSSSKSGADGDCGPTGGADSCGDGGSSCGSSCGGCGGGGD